MGEKYKDVTIKGHDFRIGKFGARDGSYIIVKVSGILAPIFGPLVKSLDVNQVKGPEDIDLKNLDIASLFGPLSSISEKDFMYLQDKCLGVTQIKMPSGYVPVMYDNGSFSVADLADDGMTLMAVMVHALLHNFAGFFDGSPLSGLLGGILATNSQNS